MDDEQQKQLLALKLKKAELQKQPYGTNTDQLVEIQRQIEAATPKPVATGTPTQYETVEPHVERINKEEAAKFQKGFNAPMDYGKGMEDAGNEVSDTWKKIRSSLGM